MRLVSYIVTFTALICSTALNAQQYEQAQSNILSQEWEALLDGDYEYNIDRLGGCDVAEKRLKLAMASGYDPNKAWMMIGMCRYKAADRQRFDNSPKNCAKLKTSERENMSHIKVRKFASEAYNQVEPSYHDYEQAKKWLSFINLEISAADYSCIREHHPPPMCAYVLNEYYNDVERGLKPQLIDRCKGFKSRYDSVFRKPK